ncbi:MAG TPA: fibronectin type III domain-containing protein [Chitinivibrionales bacterium]|nr:fibronectin type III domain-containing protein [Chitinivibrionales bacterium]
MKSRTMRTRSSLAKVIGVLTVGLVTSCVPPIGDTTPNTTGSVPGIPSGVAVTGSTISTISVKWNAVAGATSYTVYYTLDGSQPGANNYADYVSDLTTTSTVISHVTSSYGQPIEIAVTATNDNGEGNASAMVAGSTLIPTNVVVTPADSGKFTVTWSAVSGAASYNVYEKNSALDSAIGPTETAYGKEITNVSSPFHWVNAAVGHYYRFAVSAVDASGNEGGLSQVGTAVAQ